MYLVSDPLGLQGVSRLTGMCRIHWGILIRWGWQKLLFPQKNKPFG